MASAIIYTKSQNEYQLLQNIRQIKAPKNNSNQRASTLKILLKLEKVVLNNFSFPRSLCVDSLRMSGYKLNMLV